MNKDNTQPDNDKQLDEILDTVISNGITKGQQYSEGQKGTNTIVSDTLYSAKQSLNRLIVKARIDEIDHAYFCYRDQEVANKRLIELNKELGGDLDNE